MCRISSVSVVTTLSNGLSPAAARDLCLLRNAQTGCGRFGYRVQVAGHFNLALNLRMIGDKLPLSLYDLMACTFFSLYLVLFIHKIFNFYPLPPIFTYRHFCSFSSLHFPYVIFLIRSIIFLFLLLHLLLLLLLLLLQF